MIFVGIAIMLGTLAVLVSLALLSPPDEKADSKKIAQLELDIYKHPFCTCGAPAEKAMKIDDLNRTWLLWRCAHDNCNFTFFPGNEIV